MIEALKALDLSLFIWLNSFHVSWLDRPMVLLSGLVLWIPLIVLMIWYCKKSLGNGLTALFVLLMVLLVVSSDVTSSYILKNIFNRLRPCREADLLPFIHQFGQKCGGKFGFVSSHAANTTAMVLFFLRSLRPSKAWYLLIGMPLIISYSRIYLGVHYPGDILGGFLVGFLWSSVFVWCFRRVGVKAQV